MTTADNGDVPSVEVTWIVEPLARGGEPEVAMARARVEAAMFPGGGQPARVGRYVILDRLGAGGMGVVYAAYDPELDRKVAIKLLHAVGGDAQQALLREARVLARLSHKNVVGVHDVGTFELRARHDGDPRVRTFVAMEFIEGQTFTAWLHERPRTLREVLDIMLQAGEGLAAAHAVGIVHRDFKPDNVLVDRNDHARVVDFGLARSRADDPSAISIDGDRPAPGTDDQTGGIAGTPAYMSPEQVSGLSTDARTDQFSFCVALWEALYAQRPFAGSSFVELASNIVEGQRSPPPRGVRIPRWLRAAIDRGLMTDPDQRWPSLPALLDVLRRGRARALVVGALAAVTVVALTVAGAMAYQRLDERRRVAACERTGAEIDAVWNDHERAAVRDSVLASGVVGAELTAEKLAPWLDAHAAAWKRARTEACLDGRVYDAWSADTLERAVSCLDDRRLELDALVAELRRVDGDVAMRAVESAAGLRQIDPCRDVAVLQRIPAPPSEARDDVLSIRAELSRAATLRSMGRYEDGLAIARESSRRAQEVGWPPLVASVGVSVGLLLEQQGQYREAEIELEAAFFTAATSGSTEDAVTAAQGLASLVGGTLMRPREGERWWKLGDLLRAGLADPARLWDAASDDSLASVRHATGDFAQAIELHEDALAIRESALGSDHPAIADALLNIAALRRSMGDHAAAIALHERAFDIWERSLGPEHPNVALALATLAQAKSDAGAYEESIALGERALQLAERALGPDHPELALVVNVVGTLYYAVNEHERAATHYTSALRGMEKSLGAEHPSVAGVLNNLALVRNATGDYAEAARVFERALAISERVLGPSHPDVGLCLNNLATTRLSMGDEERAGALFERALTVWSDAYGFEDTRVAAVLVNLAGVRQVLGAYEEAGRLYERAVPVLAKTVGTEHPLYANAIDGLAMVREEEGAWDEAARLHGETLAIRERALGPDNPEVARALEGLARVALAQHRGTDAVEHAERALQLREAGQVPAVQLADARFLLARALVEVGSDHRRAIDLARQARDGYRNGGDAERDALSDTEAWLRTQGVR